MNFDLTEEQRAWQRIVHDFVAKEVLPNAREVDVTSEFNWSAARKMGPLGLLGLNIPEEYGGAGVDAVSAAIALEEIGWGCGSTALAIAAHNGLGITPIVLFGSEELKQKWLPLVASGQNKLAALALTEPGAGSDLQGGVVTKAAREGKEWVINGSKMWCTNASIAEYILTLVRTDPNGGSRSLSQILVPTNTPGLTIGPPEKENGLARFSHSRCDLSRRPCSDWEFDRRTRQGLAANPCYPGWRPNRNRRDFHRTCPGCL
jgi:alkylation response protein AidB-like acyl-CoA dehydrogenase